MKRFQKLAAAAGLAMVLSACGIVNDHAELRALTPPDDKFAGTFAAELKQFAVTELDDMRDLIDGMYFGEKAKRAAAGDVVEPERIDDWRLPKPAARQLSDGRARLMAVLGGGARQLEPVTAALAIARFDCWIEQQEENWQWAHIAACRDGFFAKLTELEGDIILSFGDARGEPVAGAGTAPGITPVNQPALPESRFTSRAFTMHFEFDSAQIAGDNQVALRRALETIRAGADTTIVLAGHADRAGPDWYNDGLSKRRALAVKRALIAAGVDADAITVKSFGERRPRIMTTDGLRERRNRRVEIVIGRAAAL